ncbi:MAG: hypothetical protein WD896_01590 [Parcubacteria group bacterium]
MKTPVKALLTVLRVAQLAVHAVTSKQYFEEAGAKWFGSNFEDQFFGLEVPPVQNGELAVHRLEEPSFDESILAALGDKAEISVSEFKAFLAKNRESREWFIFYLRGKDGNLSAVGAFWNAGNGWNVNANSVTNPNKWNAGNQVVSRNYKFSSRFRAGEFLLRLFFQPPSSRPMDSSFSNNSVYCLAVSSLFSQEISKKRLSIFSPMPKRSGLGNFRYRLSQVV